MKLHRQDYSCVGNKKDIFTLVTADQILKKTNKKNCLANIWWWKLAWTSKVGDLTITNVDWCLNKIKLKILSKILIYLKGNR